MTVTTTEDPRTTHPPNGDLGLFRAVFPGVELRAAGGDSGDAATGMPTLFGHFAVFNRFTEIDSMWEGNFLERFSPGAFKKTFSERKDRMRALFQHGRDPQIGDKPLGPIDILREDDTGAYYEVPLLDTAYNRELLPGLKENLYGASFRFKVMVEEVVEDPGVSDQNPKGLPERTVKEAQVMEFGPVTFGAYPGATSGVRSLTDNFILEQLFAGDPERFRSVLAKTLGLVPEAESAENEEETREDAETTSESGSEREDEESRDDARPEPGAGQLHSPKVAATQPSSPIYGESRKETPSWLL